MAQKSLDLIEEMRARIAHVQPVTGRGVSYILFIAKLISSMAKPETAKVYRLLTLARERGIISPGWIVDEHGHRERACTWDDPDDYADCVIGGYRRNYWIQQRHRVLLASEKGTVRGLLLPVLEAYGVDFQPMGGFGSFNKANDIAQDNDGRSLIVLYVGDYDPSGLWMSERDLPERIARYGGDHVTVKRIALKRSDLVHLPSFSASDKKKDPRYKWFLKNYGTRCWEIDAMNPNTLRNRVERAIISLIEPTAWQRCKIVERAERDSLATVLRAWKT
jgi:hypothetical protein